MKKAMFRTYVDAIPSDALPIPGFPKYFATREGEIFSAFGRFKKRKFGRNSCGYPICGLQTHSNGIKFVMVHRIIAKLFVPGDSSLEVNHIDMDKANCKASNLEWVTKSDNHLKAHALQPWRGLNARGALSKRVIATHPDTCEEREFSSGKEAAKFIGNGTAAGNISKACKHGREAYGFYWRMA